MTEALITASDKVIAMEQELIGLRLEGLLGKADSNEKAIIKDLLEASFRFIFLVSWIRAQLENDLNEDLVETLREMFFEGEEDNFETFYPSLAAAHAAELRSERLYAESKMRACAEVAERTE